MLGARHAARVMLAGDQPPFPVARIAVRIVRGLAEHAHGAVLLVPAKHAVVRYVAPDEATQVAEVNRPFTPAATGEETFDSTGPDVEREARIERDDVGVRIVRWRAPIARHDG